VLVFRGKLLHDPGRAQADTFDYKECLSGVRFFVFKISFCWCVTHE
jgi:hypothetical protein